MRPGPRRRALVRTVAVALAIAFASPREATSAATPPSPAWHQLSEDIGHDLAVDDKGRLWTIAPETAVRMLPDAANAQGAPASLPWVTMAPPANQAAHAFAVTPDDTLYVACAERTGGLATVFRRGIDPAAIWEELPVPAAYGRLTAVAVDDSGRVWLGGERGEIFRLSGRRWVKEVLPAPLHCSPIICVGGNRIWARAQTRSDVRIVMRSEGHWRTILASREQPTAELLYADFETAILNVGTRLDRLSANRPGMAEPWIDLKSAIRTVESRHSAWAIQGRRLIHAVDDRIIDCGEVPFLPLYCWWSGGHLWACAESGLWRFDGDGTATAAPLEWSLGLAPDRIPVEAIGAQPTYGLGVLDLEGSAHLYLARYTAIDVVIPLGSTERMRTWTSVCSRLGLSDETESTRFASAYEMGVATADLNADGTEDVVMSTMYDGCRLLLNVHGQRLLPWTRESGLMALRDDTCEDVDLLDADGDGDLDLYLSLLQGTDRLCLNDGAAHFTDVMPATGIVSPYGSTSALCRDLDGDGDTDIVVSSCGSGLFLSENLGVSARVPRFHTQVMMAPLASPDVATGLSTANFTGVEAADFDGDGLFDLVVGGRSQPTLFLRNRGNMRFERDDAVFTDGPPQQKVAGVLALDPDSDGDWDLAMTGRGGTHFLENTDGRLGLPAGRPQQLVFAGHNYSTGSVLADVDDDCDLDYIEALVDAVPVIYYNTNARKPLLVRVRGPQENRGAVGARVEVLHAGTVRRAAAVQEIPGGSSYVSHSSKHLSFGGLAADSLYDVSVRLPSRRQARLNAVPGRGVVDIDMQPGTAGRLMATVTKWRSGLKDPWTIAFWTLTTMSLGAVAGFGAIQKRRLATGYPWLAVVAVPAVAWGIRRLFHLNPGGMPVLAAVLGGLTCGLLAVSLARPRRRAATMSMLADFGRSLRVFDHNETPRRVIDRIVFMRRNAPANADDWPPIVPLLRDDVALFGVVVAPELAFVVEGARSVGLEHGEGALLLRRMRALQRRLLDAGDDAWARPGQIARLDDLLATTNAFRAWASRLRREVDQRLSTPLRAFLEEHANSRMALRDANIAVNVPDVVVRIPAPELARVLDILRENAVHACGGRRANLTVSARVGVGTVAVSVADDGPGVPRELRARIFEAGVSGTPGGSGYGLHAARRTIEQFGGTISLLDTPTGACFELVLGTIRAPEA